MLQSVTTTGKSNCDNDDEKKLLCQILNVSLSVGFLNQKINEEWKKSCCEKHEIFLGDYVFKTILEELSLPGQRTPTRLLDLSLAVKRLSIIFREEEIEYNLELATLMKNFISRYIRDPIPIVCHTVLDVMDNFMQSKLNLGESDNGDSKNILESLCQKFFERLTKFTIRALILFMKHTRCDLIDEETWTRLYAKIGHPELTTAITDLIIFHGIKLANENNGLGLHFDEMRRCLLEGSVEQRRAIQTKLLPKMFKSVELRNVFNNESQNLLNVHDEFYASADPIRAIEVILSMTKFFIFNPTSTALSWHDCVDVQLLAEAIVVDDVEVRMLAWHLICQNPRLTRPFSYDELLLARLFIASNMTEQSPGIRQKIVAEFKILMQRMRESYKLLKKKLTPENRDLFYELATSELFPTKTSDISSDDSCNTMILKNHKEFLRFIHDFIFDSIGEEANFNRKLLALFLIEIMHESEASYKNGAADLMYKELEMQSWLNQECYDQLRAVMSDDFEINQGIAERLLSKLPFKDIKRPHYDKIPLDFKNNYYKSRCFWKDIFAGGDQHLQAAMKNVQILIQKEIKNIEKDKEEYLGGYIPLTNLIIYVNGFFESGIYSQIENIIPWETYIPQTLIPLCLTVGKLVSPVVHSCAPEGFYPDDKSDDIDGKKGKERSKKSQQLLVNCWRTHKEISVVFKNFLQFAFEKNAAQSLSKNGMKLLPPNLLQNLKEYLWTQLTECRQIGAFEAAAATFQIICSILWKLEDEGKKENNIFLHDYSSVENGINNLCETRRSAGLPPLIVAILTTEPKQRNHAAFTNCMERMFAIQLQDPGMM
uniref:DUF2428 domain-containing protein n=1 Tax=Panagrolaimus superbus TaxID=310955 RepID=A0A914YMD4_9BILA